MRELVEVVVGGLDAKPSVEWDTSKPSGDPTRLMDMTRAKAMGFLPEISIQDGVKGVIDWFLAHRDQIDKRFNVFKEGIAV